jgi:drug/metabolite transporter (DMT)-like permease
MSSPPSAPPRAPSRWLLFTAFAAMCAIWGSTWLVIKIGALDVPPFSAAAARFIIAWVVMAVVAMPMARREAWRRPPRRLVLVTGLLQFAASYAIVYWCEMTLPSSLTAVLWAIYPLLLGVVAHLAAPAQSLSVRQWCGLLLGFAGIVSLFATDLGAAGPQHVGAAVVLLLSPLVVAIANVYLKLHGGNYSIILLNRDALLVGALVLSALSLACESPWQLTFPPRAVATVAYLSIIGTCLAFSLYFWSLRYLPVHVVGLTAYITPVIALLLGVVWNGEELTLPIARGTAAILFGVSLAHGKPAPRS